MTYLTDCGAPTLILDCKNSTRPSETSHIYDTLSGQNLWNHVESKVFFLERPKAYSCFSVYPLSSYIISYSIKVEDSI